MTWPHPTEYTEAVQNPAVAFADQELRSGQVAVNAMGLPLVWRGNFAAVYRVHGATGQKKWAAKCFTQQVVGQQQRYREIGDYLHRQRLPFMVDFRYLPDGVRVGKARYPILKMDWVEGLRLDEFLTKTLKRPSYKPVLRRLCEMWVRMAQMLCRAEVAHGDLQHGNVMLVPDRKKKDAYNLRLIDYDGMYVPPLAASPPGEAGHPAYQHPQRLIDGGYGPDVDRFAHLVIYTTLRCLISGGRELWDRYHDADRLLIGPQDLASPGDSPVFKDLYRLPDQAAQCLTGHLILAAGGAQEDVPLLDEVVIGSKAVALNRAQRRQLEELTLPSEDEVMEWIDDSEDRAKAATIEEKVRSQQPATASPGLALPTPRLLDYVGAMMRLSTTFHDPDIQGGHVVTNKSGQPMICHGDSATVFAVSDAANQKKWAVKCFGRQIAGMQQRYEDIGDYLRQKNLPFFVDFKYLPNEVSLQSGDYPVLKMDWVDGVRLDEFLAKCMAKPRYRPALKSLCDSWLDLAKTLSEAAVAHGDLQHGNVLVVANPGQKEYELRLVDYDGIYVPKMLGQTANEAGHPAYQHPSRSGNRGYGPKMDRFSLLLIYTTLRCLLAEGPELWDQYHCANRLLFGPQDLRFPERSHLFRGLWKRSSHTNRRLVGHLALAAKSRPGEVPLLVDVVGTHDPIVLARAQKMLATEAAVAIDNAGESPSEQPAADVASPDEEDRSRWEEIVNAFSEFGGSLMGMVDSAVTNPTSGCAIVFLLLALAFIVCTGVLTR